MSLKSRSIVFSGRLLLLALVISLTACKKTDKPSISVFASPDDAGSALLAAAKSGDQNTLLAIFGPDSKELISSGDAVQDQNRLGHEAAFCALGQAPSTSFCQRSWALSRFLNCVR